MQVQTKLDLSIALVLASWPALTLAVQNFWGGPNSNEKRDWFAGAVSELLDETPDADAQYLEEFLLQVMNDEFEVNVEDGSCEEVAEKILKLRLDIQDGSFTAVDEMFAEWQRKQAAGGDKIRTIAEGNSEDQEVDSDEETDDADEEMDDAPPLVRAANVKPPPKADVDEDGFTKVVRKNRR